MLDVLGILDKDVSSLLLPRSSSFLCHKKQNILNKDVDYDVYSNRILTKGRSSLFDHIAKENSILKFLDEYVPEEVEIEVEVPDVPRKLKYKNVKKNIDQSIKQLKKEVGKKTKEKI